MVAQNPKKKRTTATTKKTNEVAKKESTMSSEFELIEKHIGATLLAQAEAPPKLTRDLLKGKDLVGLYFGAAWCPVSKAFTPILTEFYNQCAKPNNMEIIYVSSDNTKEEFVAAYKEMPWLAMDGDQAGAMLKHNLATHLKAYSLPTFILLNVKTGNFVTDQGRKEILAIMTSEDNDNQQPTDIATKGKELVEQWKTMEPIALGHNATVLTNVQAGIDYCIKHPLMAALLVAVLLCTSIIKRIMNNPLIAVAFWLVFKNFTRERLSRNEPYMVQEETKETATAATTTGVDKKVQ